jgi:GDP-D-mannose dehydratase
MGQGKRALILGVSGQYGACLSDLLFRKGYEVVGTSRDAHLPTFAGLAQLGIRERVQRLSVAISDFRSVLTAQSRSSRTRSTTCRARARLACRSTSPWRRWSASGSGRSTSSRPSGSRGVRSVFTTRARESASGTPPGTGPARCPRHESPIRPERFVAGRIVSAACKIARAATANPYAAAKVFAHQLVALYRPHCGLFA